MGAYTYQHMHTGNHDNNGIGVNVYYLPCISDKWENPNVEEHQTESQKPEQRREVLDICKSLKNSEEIVQ